MTEKTFLTDSNRITLISTIFYLLTNRKNHPILSYRFGKDILKVD